MSAGESRGQLQGLLQRAEGLAAAGRHLSIARLDAVQLLLDQENFLACRRTHGSGEGMCYQCEQAGSNSEPCAECIEKDLILKVLVYHFHVILGILS